MPGSGDGDITVRCMLFVATADLPARAALMNMKQFNGKCAYHLCKSEGTAYGQHNIHRCWPFKQNHEKRTHEDQINFAIKATQKQAVWESRGTQFLRNCCILSIPFALLQLIDALCMSGGCQIHHDPAAILGKQRQRFLYRIE